MLIFKSVSRKLNKSNVYKMTRFDFGKVFNVPGMGDSISEGTIFELQKKVGDFVKMDEIIALVETDKVQIELKAEQAGVIEKIFGKQGETIEVGKPFVEIDL